MFKQVRSSEYCLAFGIGYLMGKFLAHLAALGIATTIGLGTAGVVAALSGGAGTDSVMALARLIA